MVKATIKRVKTPPALDAPWSASPWNKSSVIAVDQYHPHSTSHRPETQAKILYDHRGLYVMFRVKDRYVKAITTAYQGPVCKDSCVEFFVEPRRGQGYFNIEMNCGGTVLLYYVRDSRRLGEGGADAFTPIPPAYFHKMKIYHSLPLFIPEEIQKPVTWRVAYFVPFALFSHYAGPLGDPMGQTWRGNFYKIASGTSHPHWGCWSPIGKEINFHQPKYFAPLTFESI